VLIYYFVAEEQITKLMKDSGIAHDKDSLKHVVDNLKGKSMPALVSEGRQKFAAMPSGAGGASAAVAEAPKAEAKVEKKAEVVEEEVDMDMGDLFGY
jgi:ribosomal protein L12E/L44/L45/RPP1/RPP2